MPGIYVMGVLTLLAAAVLLGSLLYALSGQKTRLLWLLLPGLPLSFLINRAVKGPLAMFVAQISGTTPVFRLDQPVWWLVFLLFLAPLTEEAVKALPLLLPWARRMMQSRRAGLWVGFALGGSFGLGEVIYLAYNLGNAPQYAGIPWYLFQGFLSERLLAVPAHAFLTAITCYGLAQSWRKGLVAYLAAVLLHALVNLGAVLVQLRLTDGVTAQLLLIGAVILLAYIFERLRKISREADARAGAGESAEADVSTDKEEVVFERSGYN